MMGFSEQGSRETAGHQLVAEALMTTGGNYLPKLRGGAGRCARHLLSESWAMNRGATEPTTRTPDPARQAGNLPRAPQRASSRLRVGWTSMGRGVGPGGLRLGQRVRRITQGGIDDGAKGPLVITLM